MYLLTKENDQGVVFESRELENLEEVKENLDGYIGQVSRDVIQHGFHQLNPTVLIRLTKIEKDNVNNPSHYTQGKVECIDALESATVGKKGIEAVCVANVVKYLWRYEEKNGLEDVKKAEYYLKKLIDIMEKSN